MLYRMLRENLSESCIPGLGGSHSTPSRNRQAPGGGNLVTKKRSAHHHSEPKSVTHFSLKKLLIIRLPSQYPSSSHRNMEGHECAWICRRSWIIPWKTAYTTRSWRT